MLSPWNRTASASGLSRRPAHASQVPASASASAHAASSPALLVVETGELDAGAVAARGTSRSASCTRTSADRAARSCGCTTGTRAPSRRARRPPHRRPSGTSKGRRQHAHHVAAELDGSRERVGELAGRGRSNVELRDGQLDVVLLETVEPRPRVGRRQHAVDAQRTRSRGSPPSRRARCSSPCGR